MAAVAILKRCSARRFSTLALKQQKINTVDESEIRQFDANSSKWWDRYGEFAMLHQMNPVSLCNEAPLSGKTLLDIGCGGGLVTEAAARLGATVTGVDASHNNIQTARQHAQLDPVTRQINYRAEPAENLIGEGKQFDIVTALEVIEHVSDTNGFVQTCATLLKPNGLILFSTINRTAASYGLTIFAAEKLLRWVSPGTHTFSKYVTPEELKNLLQKNGLKQIQESGVGYNPLTKSWFLTPVMAVNYIVAAIKP